MKARRPKAGSIFSELVINNYALIFHFALGVSLVFYLLGINKKGRVFG